MTTDRVDALRDAARQGTAALPKAEALHGAATARSDLPAALDRVERSSSSPAPPS
ncbi:hypothetical protein SHKM778_79940 [Streptomyces sp. KM77-8]|uniref:Amidase n=1 Tax=Streptomyces haneummycinicus TaxID=3074435 RepID=A0AAT9HW43_9ACTN